MRLLVFHVDHFASTVTEPGRSTVRDESPTKRVEVWDALVAFVAVERDDERDPAYVARRASEELARIRSQVKVGTVVLHSFAHLFADLARPDVARDILRATADALRSQGFAVESTPFGWFNTLDVQTKGHPLARIARQIRPPATDAP